MIYACQLIIAFRPMAPIQDQTFSMRMHAWHAFMLAHLCAAANYAIDIPGMLTC